MRKALKENSVIAGTLNCLNGNQITATYTVEKFLGAGGSGLVYLCSDDSNKKYALKELYPKELEYMLKRIDDRVEYSAFAPEDIKASFEWYKQNLIRENQLCKQISSIRNLENNDPFFLDCKGILVINETTIYSVYETFYGFSLEEYIASNKEKGNLNSIEYLSRILGITAIIAKKTTLLHCQNILHLDISPSNILLVDYGAGLINSKDSDTPCLLDFGSAYKKDEETIIDHRFSASEGYSAPEIVAKCQGLGDEYTVDESADTYSIVAVLYAAVMGETFDDPLGLYIHKQNNILSAFPKDVSHALSEIFIKGLHVEPWERFGSTDELAEALLQARGELLQNGNVDLTPILDRMMKLEYTLRDFGEKLVEVKVIQMDQGETLKHIVSKLTDAQSEEINNRLIRIHQLLESESWDEAISRCSQVLDKVPENLTAHLYMLLAELKVDDVTKIDYHNTELKNDHTLNWLKEHTEGALFDVIDNIPPAGFTNIKSIVYKFSQAQDYMANTKDMVCVLNELLTDVFGIHILLRRENYNKNYRIYIPSDLNFETIDNLDELAHFFTYLNVIDFSVSCKHSDFSVSNHILYSKNGDILYKCPNNIIIERIDSTVSKISNYAFCDCYLLTTLKIPDSVNELGIGCFSGCESLITTNIPKGVEIISDFCFSRCKSLKNIDLHEDIVEIGEGAFTDCSSLTKIIVPANVRHIGNIAFSDCKSLKKVVLNEGLASIGDDSFYGCSALEPINIPTSVKEIKHASFEYTNGVEEEASYNGYSPLESAGNPNDVDVLTAGAFLGEFCANSDCSKIKKVHLPNSVSEIKERDFYGYDSLRMIYISKSVAKIERGAFKFCKFLKAIDVDPDNMFFCSINGVLYSKDMETIIYCPIASGIDVNLNLNFIKHIDDFAFCNNSSIKQIIIPEGVTSVGFMAFDSCKKLKQIEFPSSLIDIGRFAFSDCNSLRYVTCSKNNIDLIKKSIRPDIRSKIIFQIKT